MSELEVTDKLKDMDRDYNSIPWNEQRMEITKKTSWERGMKELESYGIAHDGKSSCPVLKRNHIIYIGDEEDGKIAFESAGVNFHSSWTGWFIAGITAALTGEEKTAYRKAVKEAFGRK